MVEHLKLPKQLLDYHFRIVKARGKRPDVEREWQTKNNYRVTQELAEMILKSGLNYGFTCPSGFCCFVDADTKEVQNLLDQNKLTFRYSSGTPGHYQYVYFVEEGIGCMPLKDGAYIKGKGGFTVGPKKNSEQSEEKIHRTEEVKSFIQQLGIEDFPQGRFKHAIDLYREALSCYENGDFMASTIMCRISMESMIFLCNANFQKSQDGMNYQLDLDSTKRNNSGDLKNSLYSENIKVARDEGYLNEDVCKWLSADLDPNDKEVGIIRHSGDFVAHYSEKLVKDLDLQQRSAVPVNLWIDQKRAHDILSKTCIALKSTNNNYKSINGI